MRGAQLSEERRVQVLRLLQAGLSVYRVVQLTGVSEKTVAKIRDAVGIKPYPRGRRSAPSDWDPAAESLRVFREVGGVRLIRAGFPAVSEHPDRACLGADPALFFNEKTGYMGKRDEARAKAICDRCPVLDECKAWALPITDLYGLWGGMTMREREDWRINNAAEAS